MRLKTKLNTSAYYKLLPCYHVRTVMYMTRLNSFEVKILKFLIQMITPQVFEWSQIWMKKYKYKNFKFQNQIEIYIYTSPQYPGNARIPGKNKNPGEIPGKKKIRAKFRAAKKPGFFRAHLCPELPGMLVVFSVTSYNIWSLQSCD